MGFKPVLTFGSCGGTVRELQEALLRAGFEPGAVDGEFGPATRKAVLSFQKQHGITPDGIVDDTTARALDLSVRTFDHPRRRFSGVRAGDAGSLCIPPPPSQAVCEPPPPEELLRLPGPRWPRFDGDELPTDNERLRQMGINVVLPSGYSRNRALNYDEIVDAFSHVPYPGMWQPLGIGDPTATALSYDWLFMQIRNPFPVVIEASGLNQVGCLGNTGRTNGFEIDLLDCAFRETVMHEIGHIVHHQGIERRISPLYYSRPVDMIDLLYTIFNDFGDARRDSGEWIGFVSDYSRTNMAENFAEHFMWFVYYGDSFRSRMVREREQFGSYLLSDKYSYLSRVFFGLWFGNGGQLGGHQGFGI